MARLKKDNKPLAGADREKAVRDRIENPETMITGPMGGKMYGMFSISTSCSFNACCQGRIEKAIQDIRNHSATAAALLDHYLLPSDDKKHISGRLLADRLTAIGCPVCVCIFCYADRGQVFQDSARNKFDGNGAFFQSVRPVNQLPRINSEILPIIDNMPVFRIEAMGDTANSEQALNYINLAKLNPDIRFTAWTKNPAHYWNAMETNGGLPDNLQLIYSGSFVNDIDGAQAGFHSWNEKSRAVFGKDMFTRVFVVVTESFAKAHGIKPNCCRLNGDGQGHKTQCLRDCGECYGTLATYPDYLRIEILR